MLRLLKYLKPYLLLVLIAIGLLFVQANSDLALPDYLSKIVNNGIQQNGIESAVPTAIRQSQMDRVLSFVNAEDKALVLAGYTLLDQNSPDYSTYLSQVPALANEPVYVLKPMDKAEITRLNPILAKGLLIVSFIQQAVADPAEFERVNYMKVLSSY